jgi:hypothetical protein
MHMHINQPTNITCTMCHKLSLQTECQKGVWHAHICTVQVASKASLHSGLLVLPGRQALDCCMQQCTHR